MLLKDVSMYGLFRILLVINLILPLLFLPIAWFIYLVNPESLHVDMEQIKFLGISVSMDIANALFYPIIALLFLISALVKSSFQSIFVRALAKYTPIGRIQLGQ